MNNLYECWRTVSISEYWYCSVWFISLGISVWPKICFFDKVLFWDSQIKISYRKCFWMKFHKFWKFQCLFYSRIFLLKSILVLFLGFLFECSLFLLALIVDLCLKILLAFVKLIHLSLAILIELSLIFTCWPHKVKFILSGSLGLKFWG